MAAPTQRFVYIAATLLLARAAGAQPVLLDFGTLQHGHNSSAGAVSADGCIVLGTNNEPSAAAMWTSNAGLHALGPDPAPSYAIVGGVSGNGAVAVGGLGHPGVSVEDAFRWTAAGGFQTLGFLPGFTIAAASAASFDGSVIVGSVSSQNVPTAFIWTAAQGMQRMAPPSFTWSDAVSISADGTAASGTAYFASTTPRAFRWTAGSGMQDLGALTAGGFS